MLAPIYELFFDSGYLALTENQVEIFYRRYQSDNPDDMQAIIDQKLAPGKTACSFSAQIEPLTVGAANVPKVYCIYFEVSILKYSK